VTDPHRGEIERFDLNERLVHWTTALLFLSLVVTGTILYIPSFMLAVGHRGLIVNVHVITGIGLLAPFLLGMAGPWRARLAEDVKRIDRWQQTDFDYFRPSRIGLGTGKFNAGQKLAGAVLGGGSVVMLVTGVVMRWSPPFSNEWARGATLVHDTIYLVLTIVVIGHIALGLSRPVQLKAIFTGKVPRRWAEEHAPSWLDGTDLRGSFRRARTRPRLSAGPGGAAGGDTTPASGST
jgi:formate dehydrogenase subunit gamma